jgi:hypothetical protein
VSTTTWNLVRARRLARGYLLAPAPRERLCHAVCELGGVQAQVLPAALHALCLRVAGLTREDAAGELWERRRLVKMWFIRGTLHLLPAAEAARWAAAVRALPGEQPWHDRHSLDAQQGEALLAAMADALDGRALTRVQLTDEVCRRTSGRVRELMLSPWGQLVAEGCRAGIVCFGPSQGASVTFVRLDQWTGLPSKELDGDAELRSLVRRFVRTYGPLTHQGVARWFGVRPPDGRALLALLGDELEPVQVERTRALVLAGDHEWDGDARSVRLLARYDPYLLGSNPRESAVPDAVRPRIRETGRGRLEGATGVDTLLVDGLVAGLWRRQRTPHGSEVVIEPIGEMPRGRRRELEAAMRAIGEPARS